MPPKRRHQTPPPESDSPIAMKRPRGGNFTKSQRGTKGKDQGHKSAESPILIGSELDSRDKENILVETERNALFVCSPESILILEDAIDLEDYKVRLRYFWGHIFVLVRNLTSKERQDIFRSTLPLFAEKASDMRIKLEMEFDACYRSFQKHFIRQIEKYGRRWLDSEACVKFLEVEAMARFVLTHDSLYTLQAPSTLCRVPDQNASRKQRRPKQYPPPPEPETGQDLLRFQEFEGLRWNYFKAIDFWSLCLPAYETLEAPPNHVGWFATQPRADLEDIAYQELGGIALELIRRFAIFELRSPRGYSLEAHTSALRRVMPALSSEEMFDIKILPARLGVRPIKLEVIVKMPDYELDVWAGTDANFDPADVEDKASEAHPGDMRQDDALLTEYLKKVDDNTVRADEGLPMANDIGVREYDQLTTCAAEVEQDIQTTFAETLQEGLENTMCMGASYIPDFEDIAIPHLRAPQILEGPKWTKRAEAYANGNIWARQLMAQTDRVLELRRLNALLVAAQHAISLLDEEEGKYQTEIAELQAGNQYLREAWQQVQERIKRNKVLKEKRDAMSKEADFWKQSRLGEESGGEFAGFSTGIGLRFRARNVSGGAASFPGPAVSAFGEGIAHTFQSPTTRHGGQQGPPKIGFYSTSNHPIGHTTQVPSMLLQQGCGSPGAEPTARSRLPSTNSVNLETPYPSRHASVSQSQTSFLSTSTYLDPSGQSREESLAPTPCEEDESHESSPGPNGSSQVAVHDTSSIVAARSSSQTAGEVQKVDQKENITADMDLLEDDELLGAAALADQGVKKDK